MTTQHEHPVSGLKRTIVNIAGKPLRPISLVIGALAILATILGVVAVTGSSGTAQAEHPETYTERGPIGPFVINQPPDFMIHSRARKDIVIQRSKFAPGEGAWHIHPGPSFIFVEEGKIRLKRFTKKDGCINTEWFGPDEDAGQVYFEVGNEVHRAEVAGPGPAVVLVTRFNIPVNGPITIPVADPEGPGCPTE
jgi:hypothetical protein